MFEIACALVVAVYVLARLRAEREPRGWAGWMLFVAAGGAIGENTCIAFYDFYAYSDRWSLFIGHVPMMVILIWPCVIDSALTLARRLAPRRAAVVAGAIVLLDAALMEPIATRSELWRWFAPGLFDVPPIGLVGWGAFAGAAVFVQRLPWGWRLPAVLALTHAALIAAWWGVLRWVSVPIPEGAAAAAAWGVALVLSALVLRGAWWRRVSPGQMLLRIPAALIFAALLALDSGGALLAYAAAFVPPYVALTPWGALLNLPKKQRQC